MRVARTSVDMYVILLHGSLSHSITASLEITGAKKAAIHSEVLYVITRHIPPG